MATLLDHRCLWLLDDALIGCATSFEVIQPITNRVL
jgi:hypothetical protein